MLTYTADAGSEQTAKLSVHTSQQLHDKHGRAPEITAAVYIAEALAETGFSAEVTYDHPIKDPPIDSSDCSSTDGWESGTHSWWEERLPGVSDDQKEKDGNLLLVDSPGGGCTDDPGSVGVAGGADIEVAHTTYQTELHQPDEFGSWQGRVYAILHETGHFFGLGHGHGIIENDYSRGRYYHTPNGPGGGNANPCGQIADDPDPTFDQYLWAYYNKDCSAGRIEEMIVEEDDGGGGEDPPPGDEPTVTVDVNAGSGSATCEATLHNATIDYWQFQLYDSTGTNIGYKEGNPVTFDLPGDGSYTAEAIAKTQGGDWVRGEQQFDADGGGGSDPSGPEVEISVANLHQTNGQIDCLASASDPDGEITSYEWELIEDGWGTVDSASGNPTELYADGPAEYTVRVEVEDDDGNTASAETDLRWNQPPSVTIDDVSVDDTTGEISGAASGSDPDGFIESYQWELVDGGEVVDGDTGQNGTLQAPTGGTYEVYVIVTDNDGNSVDDGTTVTYSPDDGGSDPGNQEPSVNITSINQGQELQVHLDANASDPDGSIQSIEWEILQDGDVVDTATGASATASVPEEGDYTARVVAIDDMGASASDSVGFYYGEGGGYSRAQLAIAAVAAAGLWWAQRDR